jgi:hypothetical protein
LAVPRSIDVEIQPLNTETLRHVDASDTENVHEESSSARAGLRPELEILHRRVHDIGERIVKCRTKLLLDATVGGFTDSEVRDFSVEFSVELFLDLASCLGRERPSGG